jgi:RNA polymerase sigma factor (sigma-70 family)
MALTADDRQWIDGLAGAGERHEHACRELHAVLYCAARFQIRRRYGTSLVSGSDVDDIACQAASDALLAVIRKAGDFRGDSRFTTWARRFVEFEVKAKLRQHLARRTDEPLWIESGDGLVSVDPGPDIHAEAGELADAILTVADTRLNARQRAVFWGLVGGEPSGVLGRRLGIKDNAVYQARFEVRRRLRTELLAQGFLQLRRQVLLCRPSESHLHANA